MKLRFFRILKRKRLLELYNSFNMWNVGSESSNKLPEEKNTYEEFKKNMAARSVGVYPCPDDHASTPMYLDGGELRFRCCAGPAGKCKIEEITHLYRTVRRLCNLNDRLTRENNRLRQEVAQSGCSAPQNSFGFAFSKAEDATILRQEVAQSTWSRISAPNPENKSTFVVSTAEDLIGFGRQEAKEQFKKPEPVNRDIHFHTTNITYNIIGDSAIERSGVYLLRAARKRLINVNNGAVECLMKDPNNPVNKELLAMSKENRLKFRRTVIERLIPVVNELPVEEREGVRKDLETAIEEIRREEEVEQQKQLSKG
jgi:Fe-S cluster assembly iron-binding protein IscA